MQSKLFGQNSRAELEVLIAGLRKINDAEKSVMDEVQVEAIALNLSTLESQLWNRYYRWEKQ